MCLLVAQASKSVSRWIGQELEVQDPGAYALAEAGAHMFAGDDQLAFLGIGRVVDRSHEVGIEAHVASEGNEEKRKRDAVELSRIEGFRRGAGLTDLIVELQAIDSIEESTGFDGVRESSEDLLVNPKLHLVRQSRRIGKLRIDGRKARGRQHQRRDDGPQNGANAQARVDSLRHSLDSEALSNDTSSRGSGFVLR